MKKIESKDGIAGWKIDSPIERFLAKKADLNYFWKRIYVIFYRIFDKEYYNKGLKFIAKAIETFKDKSVLENKKLYKEYVVDMVYSLHRFGCMFDEYFLYDFYNKNVHGRLEYITDKIRWNYYAKFNGYDNLDLFNDKLKTYEIFKDYYCRKVCGIYSLEDEKKLVDTFNNNERIIVKPINSSGGQGVQIMNFADLKLEKLLNKFPDGIIVEELLKNHEVFSKFNESSLNTVRIVTIRLDEDVVYPFAYARFGRQGSCVDNAFLGGIIANVDIETGVITCAKDEKGNKYIYHPDSLQCIIGFKVPFWNELKSKVKEMAQVIPENRYTGWDMAFIEDGEKGKWVMIEGNPRGQFVSQIPTGKGVKKEIDLLINQL